MDTTGGSYEFMGEKIIWVDSWRDIPDLHTSPDVLACHDPKTDTIYLVKGKASRTTLYHEIAHSVKGHSTYPESPRQFVYNEIDASMWSYHQIGRPRSILSDLRSIFLDLISIYNLKLGIAYEIIAEVLDELKVPIQWKENLNKVYKQSFLRPPPKKRAENREICGEHNNVLTTR